MLTTVLLVLGIAGLVAEAFHVSLGTVSPGWLGAALIALTFVL